jgi:hypothetical protein
MRVDFVKKTSQLKWKGPKKLRIVVCEPASATEELKKGECADLVPE